MPQIFREGKIRFEFPDGWMVIRPQDCVYYTKHFQKLAQCKEMDFLLFEPDTRCLWLLEVKDYTLHRRENPLALEDEIAVKSRDTLALLLAGAVHDSASNQIGDFMRVCKIPASLKIVLHLEHASKPNKLFPSEKFKADRAHKLRQKVGCIDKHAKVVSTERNPIPWSAIWDPQGN